MAFVVRLQRSVIRSDLGGEIGRLDLQRLHVAQLVANGDQPVQQGLGHEGGSANRGTELLGSQVEAHARVELLGRHALLGQQVDVGLVVDRAVFLLRQLGDGGNAADRLEQAFVGNGQVLLGHLIRHHALHDQLVEHLLACLRAFELARVVVRAKHLAHALALVTHHVIHFLRRDSAAVDLGKVVRAVHETRVALHAEEHERREDKHQQQQKHQAPVVAYEIKHADSGKGLYERQTTGFYQERQASRDLLPCGAIGEPFLPLRGGWSGTAGESPILPMRLSART